MGNENGKIDSDPSARLIVLEPVQVEGKIKSPAGPPSLVPPSPLAHPELKKLEASLNRFLAGLGDFLTERGELKPEKVDDAKKRVSEAIKIQIEKAEEQGVKTRPDYFIKVFLPSLYRQTEFPLLPKEDQILLIKKAGFEDETDAVEVLQRRWDSPTKRKAHFVGLYARRAQEEGEPLFVCARYYEKAASLDPENRELRIEAANALVDWARAESDEKVRASLFQNAQAHLDSVLQKTPGNLLAIRCKGEILVLQGRVQEAVALYEERLKDAPEESSLPREVYDVEREKDLDARVIHLAASRAMRDWAESLPKGASTQDARLLLIQGSLAHAEAVLEKNPKDRLALRAKAEGLSSLAKTAVSLGKTEEADAIFSSAQAAQDDLLRVEFDDRLDALKKKTEGGSEEEKKGVERLMPAMESLVERESAKGRCTDFERMREFYLRSGNDGKTAKFDARIRQNLSELRDSLNLPEGSKPTLEQLENARALVEADTQRSDKESLYHDLNTWTDLVYAAPPESLDRKGRLEEYCRIFKGLNSLKGEKPEAKERMEFVRSRIIDVIDESEDRIPSKDLRYIIGGRVGDFLEKVIGADEKEAQDLLPRLEASRLFDEVELQAKADLFYQRAQGIEAPAERRAALLFALRQYAALKDASKMEEVIAAIKKDLPSVSKNPSQLAEKLELNETIVSVIRGSGLPEEETLKKNCASEAEVLRNQVVEGVDGGGIPLEASQKLRGILTVFRYYGSVGDAEALKGIERAMKQVRREAEAQFASGTPPLDARGRIELAEGLVQMNLLLVDSDTADARFEIAAEASRNSVDPEASGREQETLQQSATTKEEARKRTAQHLLESVRNWEQALGEAKDLAPSFRLEQGQKILLASFSLGDLKEGESAFFTPDELEARRKAGKELILPLMEQEVRKSLAGIKFEGPRDEKEKIDAFVLADVAELLEKAHPEKRDSALFLLQMDIPGIDPFTRDCFQAHEKMERAQGALHGKPVDAWIQEIKSGKADSRTLEEAFQAAGEAAEIFSSLGFSGRTEEAARPFLELARSPSAPPKTRCDAFMKVGRLYLSCGMKSEARGVLAEIIALDVKGAPPEIHETAQIAKGIRYLHSDPPEEENALALFRGLPDNPAAQGYLKNIEKSRMQNREFQAFRLIQTVMMHHAAVLREEGKGAGAESLDRIADSFLEEVQRKFESGECKTLGEAIEKTSQDSRFRLDDFLLESWAGNAVRHFGARLGDLKGGDGAFLKAAVGMAEELARQGDPYDISPELEDLFAKNPHAEKPIAELKQKLPSLKSFARISETVMYATPFGVAFFSPSFGSLKKHWLGLVPGFMGGALGKWAFKTGFAKLAGDALGKGGLFKAGSFVAEEAGATVGMTFGRIGAQLLWTGRAEGLSWEGFWKEMGENLLMSLFTRGVGYGVKKLGSASMKVSWLTESGPGGAVSLKSWAQKGLGAAEYAGNLFAFAAADRASEMLHFREEEDLDWMTRLIGAWASQLEMGSAEAHANFLKGLLKKKADSSLKPEASDASLSSPPKKAETKPILEKTERGWEFSPPPDVVVIDPATRRERAPEENGRILLRDGDILQKGEGGGEGVQRVLFKRGLFQPYESPKGVALPPPSPLPKPKTTSSNSLPVLRLEDGSRELEWIPDPDGGRRFKSPQMEIEVILSPQKDGSYTLKDPRSPSEVDGGVSTTGTQPIDLRRLPILVNGRPVTPGTEVRVKPGDSVEMGIEKVRFVPQKISPFERGLLSSDNPLALRNQILGAKNFFELKDLLRGSPLPGSKAELKSLEDCLNGKDSTDHLSPIIREKALSLMGQHVRELRRFYPKNYDPVLEGKGMEGLPKTEREYRVFREVGALTDKISAARDIDQLIAAIDSSPLSHPEGIAKKDLLDGLKLFRDGKIPIQDVPKGFGLRQKLRDFEEFKNQDFYGETKTNSFPLPSNPTERAKVKGLDQQEKILYFDLGQMGPFRGEWKEFSPLKIVETVHEVLERGKPVELITAENGLRPRVEAHMRKVVDAAKLLYPAEWARAGWRNYYTGERFSTTNDEYRFARMLLNEKAGRPLFGMPSMLERRALRNFVTQGLHEKGVVSDADALWAIRDHFMRMTPEFQAAFLRADPKTKGLLIESFFGASQHRRVGDPRRAFELARFLGKAGNYREVSVSLEFDGGMTYANLSLGDLHFVSSEDGEMYLLMHTHPEEYLNPAGEIMGWPASSLQGAPATLVMKKEAQSGDTRNTVFSAQDIDCFRYAAESLFKKFPKGAADAPSFFYDPDKRVFRNWAQNVHGLAEVEIHLRENGTVEYAEVRYAVYDKPGLDNSHENQAKSLMNYAFGFPVHVEKVDPEYIEAYMPYSLSR